MNRYDVTVRVTYIDTVTIEAESADEAMRIVDDLEFTYYDATHHADNYVPVFDVIEAMRAKEAT